LKRGSVLIISGIILSFASLFILDAIIALNQSLLTVNDFWTISLSPGDSVTRGFDIGNDDSEVIFYFDYEPRGVPMNFIIKDRNEKIVFDKHFNDYFLMKPFKPKPVSYYVATIQNNGNESVEIFEIGFQKAPQTPEEGENLILPSLEWYSTLLVSLIFLGIPIAIAGGILFVKDRRKNLAL